MKEQRWYEITIEEDGRKTLNVYSHPNKAKAQFSSHVKLEEMPYYRNNFNLWKVWTQEEIERNEILSR